MNWLKHNQGKIYGLLALILLLIPALMWGGYRAQLPCSHDNDLHYYRITAITSAFRHGWRFSRWVPNLALGYGYPFFNFREPAPYLAGALLYLLGMPLPLVLGLFYALSFLAAGWGAYILARDLWGDPRAAWISAAAYGLGPYLLMDALRRGNLPESVALALLPWLMIAFRRLIVTGGRGPFLASIGLLVTLFLSHNISSLLFAPFLGGYVVLLAWFQFKRGREKSAWPWAFGAAALAVALTAWFWGPALLEQDTVQLHLSRTTRNNDFHYNFATWREMILSLPAPYDPDFLNLPMRVPLGALRFALALVGAVVGLWRAADDERRALTAYFAAMTVGYLWMSTEASVRIWEAVPLLPFVQFPWRLIGRALLPASLLAGLAVQSLRPLSRALFSALRKTFYATHNTHHLSRITHYAFLILLTLLVISTWSFTFPPKGMCEMDAFPEMTDVYAFERAGWMGVDPEGSYFPVWVEDYPTDDRLAAAFVQSELPERLDPASLPHGAEILSATYRPLRAELALVTPQPFEARWLGFYYPGWRVTIDGAPAEIRPEPETGLLRFTVPEGEHRVVVRFGATPLRLTVTIVSILGALALLLVVGVLRQPHIISNHQPATSIQPPTSNLQLLTLLALILLCIRLIIVPRVDSPVRRARLATPGLPEVATPLHQPFEGEMILLGFEVPETTLPGDAEMQVDLLWAARGIPSREYRSMVLLMDDQDRAWSSRGSFRPRGYEPAPPTTMWLPGDYAYDPHIITPLPGAPPGNYRVVTALFDKDTLTPASVLGAEGNSQGHDLTLGTVQVTRPTQAPSLADLGVPAEATLQACGALGLWSMEIDREQAAPGDLVAVRWVWERLGETNGEAWDTARLTLRDTSGVVAREWDLPPATAWWPVSAWREGERWIGRHVVRLPGGLSDQTYTLTVSGPGCDASLAEASLSVIAPERSWTAPDGLHPADAVFAEKVALAGYKITPAETEIAPGASVQATLAWQALDEMEESYHVFLHLRDEAGRMVAQHDGIPAGWTRPTPGWAPGEVVVEERRIALPREMAPGAYTLHAGWYLPEAEGQPRLITRDEEDGVVLATFEIAD
ncbi:MAG: hypothetical protein ACLFTI_09530 [Anaerolineales bacterium]